MPDAIPPADGQPSVLNLAAFIAVVQHEVQKVSEYLARPELRQIGAGSPAQIIPYLGAVRVKVPVQMWQAPAPAPQNPASVPVDPEDLLTPGLVWPPGSKEALTVAVRTVGSSNVQAGCTDVGYLELEFTPCPKQ